MGACFGNVKFTSSDTDVKKSPGWALSDSDESEEYPLDRLKRMIKTVDIDQDGVFKYIQIVIKPRIDNNPSDTTVTIVRGYMDCTYHADILAKFEKEELTADDELHLNW